MTNQIMDQRLYIPIPSPPTPAPSPSPSTHLHIQHQSNSFASLPPQCRRRYLAAILAECTPSDLLFVSATIAPLLKRDFLHDLPPEIALYALSFIDDPKTLARASQVSRHWQSLLRDETLWKTMCDRFMFPITDHSQEPQPFQSQIYDDSLDKPPDRIPTTAEWSFPSQSRSRKETRSPRSLPDLPHTNTPIISYRMHFKHSYTTMMNWRSGGYLLCAHRLPATQTDVPVVTSVAIDSDWIVVGLANCKIYVFSAKTGVLARTLVGHELGVWAVNLVSRGGYWSAPGVSPSPRLQGSCRASSQGLGSPARRFRSTDEDVSELGASTSTLSMNDNTPVHGLEHSVPSSLRYTLGLTKPRKHGRDLGRGCDAGVGKRSDPAGASEGWGQPNALIVSGGCDKVLRVWDVKSGYCIYALSGHTSTIRCVKVLHNRPIALSGSRDSSLRVWDVQRGRQLRILNGHELSVRCIDVCGNKAVSGSYDTTCRLWDIDTGECLHVFRGHIHQIYSVAFDGIRIASGGLDTTVRVWDATTGACTALLQGHSALVCQLQLTPTILATGGSDGRVITFCLQTLESLQRIDAHESSVASLQCDDRFLVTGGNDGRARLFELDTGRYVRELSERSENVWKIVHRGDVCAVMCKRAGKTVMEFWSFRASFSGPLAMQDHDR